MGTLLYKDRLTRNNLYLVSRTLLRNDLFTVWKSFHPVVAVGLSGVFELGRDVGTRGHNFKLTIPVCFTDMGRRTFGVGVVVHWNSLPSNGVEANTITSFKNRLDRELGVKLFKIAEVKCCWGDGAWVFQLEEP